MPKILDLARVEMGLRDAVVEAALAERRAELAYDVSMRNALQNGRDTFDADTVIACDDAEDALQAAADALLAFMEGD
jgi:hypothetical protein